MRVAKKIARIVRVQIIEIIGSIEDFEKRLFPKTFHNHINLLGASIKFFDSVIFLL